jgi:Skp family chaperone for outer membrane proteins
MKKYLFLVLFIFAPVSLANADLKVAVIDLGKAFDSFYKTKDASSKIDEKKATYEKEIQDQVTEFSHMQDDAKKLYDQSVDQTLSAAARADKTAALAQKNQDLLNMKNKIQEMNTERTNEIKDEIVRRHKEILDEITKDINDYAGPQGYDLVIDISSASTASSVSIVLYHSSKMIDITADIIKQLNATAPVAGTAPTPSP